MSAGQDDRAAMAQLGLDPDDLAAAPPAPVLAVVGRPNVGKSTLVNRLIGRREAVVQDVPGVTRDRVAYDALWNGRRFTLVDTGGWEPDATGLRAAVAAQAEYAMRSADAVLLVVDAAVGATATDEAVARVLRRSQVPVLLAATKVDDDRLVADTAALWRLGLGEPHPVSGLHGRLTGDLLDAILEALPESPRDDFGANAASGPRRVALIGKPNVGKSSLLNRVSGEVRSVVHEVAGTTVDPVDSLVELDDQVWRFVDTAGLRKRVKTASGMEYYASLRTQAAIEAAEVALVLIDASEPIAEQDQRVITMVEEAGRALVLVFNKWDLVDEDRRYAMKRELERDLVRVPWAERVNVSALTGRSVAKIAPAMRTGPRVVGPAHPDRPAQRLALRRHRRYAPAGARGQAAQDPLRHPGLRPPPDASCCSPAGSWKRATGASSNGGCGRSSASTARPSASRFACARSAAARRDPPLPRRPGAVGSSCPIGVPGRGAAW